MFLPARTPPRLSTLVLLTAVSVLSLNMFLPSLANIARDLNTSYVLASLSVSGYLAVTAVLQLLLGPVADRFGRRPVVLWTIAIFVAASFLCAVSGNIWVFLVARVFQGAIISGSALASAIISDTTEKAKAASLMSYVAMAMAVAPMLAPVLGGALDMWFGWRSGFWLYTGLGLALLWLIWADLGETNPSPADTFLEQIRAYPELFRSRRFWGYAIVMSCGVGAFFLFISAAPLVGEESFGLTPANVGIGIGSITGGFFIGSFLSGRFSARMGLMWMIFAGRIFAAAGLGIALLIIVLAGPNPYVFFAGAICAGVGNGISIPSARAGSLTVRPHLAGSASGLSGALVTAFGAVLTALPGLLVTADNGPWMVLLLMLLLAVGAIVAAVFVWVVEQREAVVEHANG